MDSVKVLIKNIVICYVIINIIDALLISRKYEKYIKVFTGIIIMFVIISVGEKIIGNIVDKGDEKVVEKYIDETSKCIRDTEDKLSKLTKEIHKEYETNIVKCMYEEYEIKIKNIDIYEDGEKGIYKIVVRVKDKIDKVILTKDDKDKIESLVKKKILQYYDIGKECIKIRFV